MTTQNLNSAIQARVEAFSMELVELIRQATLEVVRDALEGSEGLTRRGRGRARTTDQAGRGLDLARGGSRSRRKGAKRDPQELVTLTETLLAYIKANPGQRIEEVARGMGATTKELSLPAKKLLATRKVKTKGQKRATQYFVR